MSNLTRPDATHRIHKEVGMHRLGSSIVLAWAILHTGISLQAFELKRQLTVDGQVLKLNGAGTRSKAFVPLYESGLYLLGPSRDANAIIAADAHMAIRVKITSSFVSQSTLVSALNEGLKKSTGGDTEQIRGETQSFQSCLKDDVRKGDVFDFIHIPSKGLYVFKNGQAKGLIPGVTFKRALFGVWLSEKPADQQLKQAMLSAKVVR